MIGITRNGPVMTIEMQRADRRNALNVELVDGLRETIEHAAEQDVRAIVLTGAMRPFEMERSDALQNLTEALLASSLLRFVQWKQG